MLIPSTEEFDALTRTDFNVFVERVFVEINGTTPYLDNFHIAVLCAELEAVRAGVTRRLAVTLPPRSLKSLVVSVAWPAWLLGHDPAIEIVCASYGQHLADILARDCRQVLQSVWYCKLFPATRLASAREPLGALETTAHGIRRATSVGGSFTGIGGDVLIIDDPTKPEEAHSDVERAKANSWARHTVFTRLDDKAKGSVVLVMQRLHEDDLVGHVAALSSIKLVSFPAIAQHDEHYRFKTPFGVREHRRAAGEALHPAREPLEVLDEIRRVIGTRFFAAQYLQMPAPPGGSLVKPEWFQRFDPASAPPFDQIIQSWDTASKASQLSDYSACTTWGRRGRQLFLLHVLRKRLEYPDLKRAVIAQATLFGAGCVLIEEAASGIALIQDLKSAGFYKAVAVKPKGDKVMRMQTQTAAIEAGQVFVPSAAAWLEEYLHEMMMFPAARHDDQVDSTSQALGYVFTANINGDAWAAFMRECAGISEPQVGTIRVNHHNRSISFRLNTGREPVREADGSFLVTDEEYQPLIWAGVYKVE